MFDGRDEESSIACKRITFGDPCVVEPTGRNRADPYSLGELMFDHVRFGVSDFAANKAFFLKALEPLDVTVVSEWPPNGVELSQPN